MKAPSGSAERAAAREWVAKSDDEKTSKPAEYLHQDKLSGTYSDSWAVERCNADGWTGVVRIAFYNIGWNHESKAHTKERLAEEIYDMVHHKLLDALGVSEVLSLRNDTLQPERLLIMQAIVEKLNSSAGLVASSADGLDSSAERSAWRGQADGHYIFLWNTKRIILQAYEYISCGVESEPWRKAQYLKFQHAETQRSPPLHVCHNQSPLHSRENTSLKREKKI